MRLATSVGGFRGPSWLPWACLTVSLLNAAQVVGALVTGNGVKFYEVVLAVAFGVMAVFGRRPPHRP